ncbi:alpha/beta fold hydrolase [Marinobacter nauticus]|uniref:alpha/beta fold hydrolase n=1 Tax=Marinobacter nauticus TaxID=2743 RepID=UPI0035133101
MVKTSGYVPSGDTTIYYDLSGNLDGEPLLMLHGGLGSGRDLAPLHEYVTRTHCLISIDLRGHGKSPLLGASPTYALYEKDIKEVLSQLGIKRYSIFGFSDGGIVGYRLAANHPEAVVSLVTLGSQWRLEADDPAIDILKSLTAEFWCDHFPSDVEAYISTNPSPDFKRLLNAVKEVWLDTTESGYPGCLVERIKCPSLIMRGDDDFLFSLTEAAALKNNIPNASFANIPFAQHAAHREVPMLVGSILRQFLSYHTGLSDSDCCCA